jgi:cobalt/nickel transport system ATP-binding protein
MTTMPLFELESVRFHYDAIPALDSLTLAIGRGRRVALLGANGSGKSTLLRILGGLAFPEDGLVRFDGAPLTEERMREDAYALAFRRRVGILFQNADVQLFNPTVYDELAFGPLQLGWPRETIVAKIEETLEQLAISELRDRSPQRLSGGEKRRVALASVLIAGPEVVLLDEPTAMLDPRGQNAIIDLLAGWAGGTRTVVTTTHDLGILEDIADHCVVLQAGHLVAQGTPHEILSDEPLLRATGLLHQHRHVHEDGVVHSHPHRHGRHEHG